MRGWLITALLATFFSGGATGYLVGQQSVPAPVEKHWWDGAIQTLRESGVTDPQDIEDAKEIYREFDEKVTLFKNQIEATYKDQLNDLNRQATEKIEAILAKYRKDKGR
jgi:hypothetical protein